MSILADAGLSGDNFDFDAAVEEDEDVELESPDPSDEGVSEEEEETVVSESTEPSLEDNLRKFGLSLDELPDDPEIRTLLNKVVEHGNSRVAGVMSGSTKAVQDAAEAHRKARLYDQMQAEQSKETPKSPWDDLDTKNLPTDAFERFRVLAKMAAQEGLSEELSAIRADLGLLKSVTANSAWQQFLSQNEDISEHEEEIKGLITRGIPPSNAAEYVRKMHLDVEGAVASRLQEKADKIKAKSKAGGTVKKTRTKSPSQELTEEQVSEMSRSDYLRHLMENAAKETGMTFDN